MNLLETYNSLTQEQKEFLNYAFENKISQIVELGDRRFIGVNVYPTPYMTIEAEQNSWSIGVFKEKE